jgi:aminoglycoside phosphotransferase (APT) family kinase protein
MTFGQAGSDPEVSEVRAGESFDETALSAYLSRALGWDGPISVLQFPHGTANLTYLLTTGEGRFVLRRPPHGGLAAGAHDMRREYRVLSELWRGYDRAARAIHFCDDVEVIGAPFLIMEYREGIVLRNDLPGAFAMLDGVGERISRAFIAAVADLHLVDAASVGLERLGRPEGYTTRQLDGWNARWETAKLADDDADMDAVFARLSRAVPDPQRVSLVHHDLKLDNCQYPAATPDRVQSVFDWDMTTLGDPLVDLGTLLAYWPADGDAGEVNRLLWPGQQHFGLRTRAEVAGAYAEATALDLSGLSWYVAFGMWKTGIALRQLANRALSGESADTRQAAFAEYVPACGRAAQRILDTGAF